MYSISSQDGSSLAFVWTVNGFWYAPGSMIVMSHDNVFRCEGVMRERLNHRAQQPDKRQNAKSSFHWLPRDTSGYLV